MIPIVNDQDLSHHGWTVDEPADVDFMRTVFDHLYVPGKCFGLADVLSYLNAKRPAIEARDRA